MGAEFSCGGEEEEGYTHAARLTPPLTLTLGLSLSLNLNLSLALSQTLALSRTLTLPLTRYTHAASAHCEWLCPVLDGVTRLTEP